MTSFVLAEEVTAYETFSSTLSPRSAPLFSKGKTNAKFLMADNQLEREKANS